MVVTLDVSSLRSQLDAKLSKLQDKLAKNLKEVFAQTLIPRIIDNVMEVYDSQLVGREPADDHARPSQVRIDFKVELERELLNSLEASANPIQLGAGSAVDYQRYVDSRFLRKLGKSPEWYEWIVMYTEGIIGEYAFISEDTFKKFVAAGKRPEESLAKFQEWGWFGRGFMINKRTYMKQGFDKIVPFTSVRHPFSGVKPTPLFESGLKGIDFKALFKKALKKL